MAIKRTRTITRKRVTNKLRIGGDENDKKGIWERLVAIILEKLPLSGSWERTTETTTIDETVESDADHFTAVDEQAEAHLQEDAQRVLEAEAVAAEQKELAKGDDNSASPEEIAETMREIAQELQAMQEDGYEVNLKELPLPDESNDA